MSDVPPPPRPRPLVALRAAGLPGLSLLAGYAGASLGAERSTSEDTDRSCEPERAAVARSEPERLRCEEELGARRRAADAEREANFATCTADCEAARSTCVDAPASPDDETPCEFARRACVTRCEDGRGDSFRFFEWELLSEEPCPGEAEAFALERCEAEVARREAVEAEEAEMRRAHAEEARRDPARAEAYAAARREANEAMVAIPAATFEMGPPDEGPATRVRLPAFLLDRLEVTTGAYALCVEAGTCRPPEAEGPGCNFRQADRAEHPMNCISGAEANRYCRWRGARLPTEPEWDYAARGDDRRIYAWGNEEPGSRPHWSGDCGGRGCGRGTAPVGSHPLDVSPFGLLDMTGNVREWVSDRMQYVGGEVDDPHAALGSFVVRAGDWGMDRSRYLRVSTRDVHAEAQAGTGFRCARRP
jgi:sulfatase modifying factor 1